MPIRTPLTHGSTLTGAHTIQSRRHCPRIIPEVRMETALAGEFVICYPEHPDYCGASSSRRSAAGCSTERKHAFGVARSGTAGTSGLRWRSRCDSPCGPCRSSACCSRLVYVSWFRWSCGLAAAIIATGAARAAVRRSELRYRYPRYMHYSLARDSHEQNLAITTLSARDLLFLLH